MRIILLNYFEYYISPYSWGNTMKKANVSLNNFTKTKYVVNYDFSTVLLLLK